MTVSKNSDTERLILSAVDDVVERVTDGETPTGAVVKAAVANKLTAGQTRLLAQAYNTGITNALRKSAGDPRSKSVSVQLADAEAALEELFPDKPKSPGEVKAATVVSAEYYRPVPDAVAGRTMPPAVKAATAAPAGSTQMPSVSRVFDACYEAAKHLEKLRLASTGAELKLAAALDALDTHFSTHGHQPFALLKTAAEAKYGDEGLTVADAIHVSTKLATAVAAGGPVDWSASPFKELTAAVAAGRELATARFKEAEFDATVGEKLAALVDMYVPHATGSAVAAGVTSVPVELSVAAATSRLLGRTEKAAGPILDTAKSLLTVGAFNSIMDGMPKGDTQDDLKAKAFAKLTDPVHDARLELLRRKFMLTNLMANDPVIKGYKPNEVLHVYNQLAQLAPRAAGQDILVQAMLRRQLAQGQTDPHEVDQLASIESKLRQIAEPMDSRKLPDRLPYVVNRPTQPPKPKEREKENKPEKRPPAINPK